jgi:hypothetical protein
MKRFLPIPTSHTLVKVTALPPGSFDRPAGEAAVTQIVVIGAAGHTDTLAVYIARWEEPNERARWIVGPCISLMRGALFSPIDVAAAVEYVEAVVRRLNRGDTAEETTTRCDQCGMRLPVPCDGTPMSVECTVEGHVVGVAVGSTARTFRILEDSVVEIAAEPLEVSRV